MLLLFAFNVSERVMPTNYSFRRNSWIINRACGHNIFCSFQISTRVFRIGLGIVLEKGEGEAIEVQLGFEIYIYGLISKFL